ncbi:MULTISPECIES: host-nuclease inhibitor Gam family protein [Serratia]|uniref:host-nuclease inhibitor Gam family protein n=1 Tax=Serratia TaxID=613 RepID=UPI0006608407|nr:host-nuclease inhibitor Gam family protein [Serratia sp. 506_PEND]
MAAKTRKLKNVAANAPQSKEEASLHIRKLGDAKREAERLETRMNDEIGAITEKYMPQIETLKKEVATLFKGIQAWCEANKDELTKGGKAKTANLTTGSVSWRFNPASCSVRNVEDVLEMLHKMGLERFIRVKEEVNKDAVLADPAAVKGIAGISIKTGVESFAVEPFEQDANI